MFSVWPKIQPKTTEIIFSRYFHFKAFPPLSHTHESLTHALPLSNLHCFDPHTKPNGTIHTDAPRSRSRRSPELRRSTSITIAIALIAIDASRDCDRADRRQSWSSKSARLRSRSRAKRRLRSWSTLRAIAIEIGEIVIAISPIEIAPIVISPRKYAVLLGFIWVFRNEWHYVFVWYLRKCEKMWATSKKCVFYGIFKNTTKHQKIFSEIFFEMQPNTWKHFLFRKIAFPENIYFSEMLLHEPNAA